MNYQGRPSWNPDTTLNPTTNNRGRLSDARSPDPMLRGNNNRKAGGQRALSVGSPYGEASSRARRPRRSSSATTVRPTPSFHIDLCRQPGPARTHINQGIPASHHSSVSGGPGGNTVTKPTANPGPARRPRAASAGGKPRDVKEQQ